MSKVLYKCYLSCALGKTWRLPQCSFRPHALLSRPSGSGYHSKSQRHQDQVRGESLSAVPAPGSAESIPVPGALLCK